jgi:hypothetical protein
VSQASLGYIIRPCLKGKGRREGRKERREGKKEEWRERGREGRKEEKERGKIIYKYNGMSFSFFLLYSYVHTRLGSFLTPCPHPLCSLPLPPTPSIPSRNYFALISNFVVERV